MPNSAQNTPRVEPPPEQPSPFLRTEEPTQPYTIKLQPPPPTARPIQHESITRSFQISLQFAELGYSWSTEEELAFCARKRRNTRSNQIGWNGNCRYIVVGIMGNEESIPHETLLPILAPEDLFKQIRKAERELRSPFDDCYRSNASADLEYIDVIPLRTTTVTQTSATRLHGVWLSFTGTIEQKRRTTKIVGWIGFIRTSTVNPLTLKTGNLLFGCSYGGRRSSLLSGRQFPSYLAW